MKSINFGSIFGRKDSLQRTDSKEQAGRRSLWERFAERQVTLKEGEVTPLAKETPSLDWTAVNGRITVLASAVEGLLEGRTRIKAQQLKSLEPCPIDRETEDSIEYAVSLAAIVSQIDDLLNDNQPETEQPEFETPFTALAREDNARFERRDKTQSRESGDHAAVRNGQSLTNAGEIPHPIATKNAEPEMDLEQSSLSLTELCSLSRKPSLGQPEITTPASQPPKANVDQAQRPESSKEVSIAVTQAEPTMVEYEVRHTAMPETGPKNQPTSRWGLELQPPQLDGELAQQGVERLQDIFMTSKPLDGRRVASLVQELPGINGALILLGGGIVLGGQLPESLSVEAALQAPEILKNFIRFIREVEAGQRAQSQFISVTAATTISLAASGDIVLLVSHQARTLPPGVAKRLIETAEALSLIYGNHHRH
jgi:hypothetical protein